MFVGLWLAASLLAGCSMLRGATAEKESEPKATAAAYGEVAPLRAIGGSAVSG
jgi:hypothetical protein